VSLALGDIVAVVLDEQALHVLQHHRYAAGEEPRVDLVQRVALVDVPEHHYCVLRHALARHPGQGEEETPQQAGHGRQCEKETQMTQFF
jgi:hypothetical protein